MAPETKLGILMRVPDDNNFGNSDISPILEGKRICQSNVDYD